MKTIKSALLGNKNLIDGNHDALLFQLKEVIKEHRSRLVTSLINNLPTYLDYKFQFKPGKNQLLEIKDKLLDLRNGGVNLTAYEAVVNQLQSRAVVHLTNEPFYIEIDEVVSSLISTELKFHSYGNHK